ncbi:arginine--tRNA ligase [Candidatus Microgenomates bacterium]|nr:arginine--tRNA ligase [Candidatus Microgenomates bacterium CPR3]RIK51352.1 MAG: arginine--tRNA ligase [Candidatus Microgenomates bacterium]
MLNPVVVVTEALGRALSASGLMPENGVPDFSVSHPKDESHGDYATNLALLLAKNLGKNPREVAEKLITNLQIDTELATLIDTTKINVAGAGFINFWLKNDYLFAQVESATVEGYGRSKRLVGQKIMVEYTDPNPFKEMHIGHLMSNTIGEAIARLIECQGATVVRACYQGDVGLHVAKAIWGMQQKLKLESIELKEIAEWELVRRQRFMGEAYALGATKYEENEGAKAEMITLNKQIYERGEESINALYDAGRAWSLEYFETIYARLGTKFDQYFFESEAGPVGLKVVEEGLAKGVLEQGEGGAVVYKGEQDGLHTRVFRNKLGLPTYEAKDLGLAKTKYERVKYDLSYIVTANEITEYFKVVLRVMEQLYPDLRAKTTHIPHGVMKLTTGKMSSRTGKVVTGEGLLNDLRDVVMTKIGEREIESKDVVADQIAVGALKYTVLRQVIGGDIVYDPEKMTNLEGATGPFVQYAYARASSILKKFEVKNEPIKLCEPSNLEDSELALMRWLYRYPEVIEEAGRALAPHMVVTYVTELAARFNSFYQNCRVEEDGEVNQFRYELTEAVANVLKSGLSILRIVAPAEM